MGDRPHAIRRTYQVGCRCAACVGVNRTYQQTYRTAQRAGRPLLGAHVAGREAARVVAALVDEGYLKAEIAAALGYRWRWLPWRVGAGVTVRTVLRLRTLQRRLTG